MEAIIVHNYLEEKPASVVLSIHSGKTFSAHVHLNRSEAEALYKSLGDIFEKSPQSIETRKEKAES